MASLQRVEVDDVYLDLSHVVVEYRTSFGLSGELKHRWVQGVSSASVPFELVVISFLLASAPSWHRETRTPVHVHLPEPLGHRANFIFRRVFGYQRPDAQRLTVDHRYGIRAGTLLCDASTSSRLPTSVAFLAQGGAQSSELTANDILLERVSRSGLAAYSDSSGASVVALDLPSEVFWLGFNGYESAWPYAPVFLEQYTRVLEAAYGGRIGVENNHASVSILDSPEAVNGNEFERVVRLVNQGGRSRREDAEMFLHDAVLSPVGSGARCLVAEDDALAAVQSPHLLEYLVWALRKPPDSSRTVTNFVSRMGAATYRNDLGSLFGPRFGRLFDVYEFLETGKKFS